MTATARHFEDAAAGLAFEQALFDADGLHVAIWSAKSPALVCPSAYARHTAFAKAAEQSKQEGWPVALRSTGGGTVPQGPGIENVVITHDALPGSTIEDGYRKLTGVLKTALGAHGDKLASGDTPGSFCDGAWNLSAGGRKIIGTAQRWRPRGRAPARVLSHAVILTTEDFRPGAKAVAAFHGDLGLPPVKPEAHTSLETAFGLSALLSMALVEATNHAFAALCSDEL